MLTIHRCEQAHAAARRVPLAVAFLGAVVLTGCGSNATSSSSGAAATATPAPTATPAATSTPGPSSVQATLTGSSAGLTGPLVTGSVHFVTCAEPTLSGPVILAFRSAADTTIGILLTIHQSSIAVRLASGSGTSYTERDFTGSGVTSFNASSGAQFSSSLTESTAAGTNKGTIGTVSSIAGSVSCGTFQVGSASLTLSGNTAGGAVGSSLTGARVLCGNNGQGVYATVTGLGQVGSTPAIITVGGGTEASPMFVVIGTASSSYQFNTSAAGSVTVTATTATYHATVTETSPVAGSHTLMVSGTASCGTSS